ncbi:unnamed protein product [Nippostrongylus brasiliensis]|uniref:Coiled-coil protein n=1 Tax=Nippostrongylus brasiliensis TaxID=27835 RepID=A0A0N4YNK3_NIPBR|nr:unnamed protein product [Nippostrongylus brasiliensis]
MSSDQYTSPSGSTVSSIPVGAEAAKYNAVHQNRPSSSRKLFGNSSEGRSQSEPSPVAIDTARLKESEGSLKTGVEGDVSTANSVTISDRLTTQLDKMMGKLSQDMERVSQMCGNNAFFMRPASSLETELSELDKLSAADARILLQQYAIRCSANEREKENLHKRNHELNETVEILRTQVMHTQINIVDQMKMVVKQALDALRSVEQSSTIDVTKWKQKGKDLSKQLDMLRFERDSLSSLKEKLERQLDDSGVKCHGLSAKVKKMEETLKAMQTEAAEREKEVTELKKKLAEVEINAEARVKQREEDITKQMDNYLKKTKMIDAERELEARMLVADAEQRLKIVKEQRDAAEKRAVIAEKKVADYEEHFAEYRGQMEGEALRAITNGYRNALSTISSARSEAVPSVDRLHLFSPLGNGSENVVLRGANDTHMVEQSTLAHRSRDLHPSGEPILIHLNSENVIPFLENYDQERVLFLADSTAPEYDSFERSFIEAMKIQRADVLFAVLNEDVDEFLLVLDELKLAKEDLPAVCYMGIGEDLHVCPLVESSIGYIEWVLRSLIDGESDESGNETGDSMENDDEIEVEFSFSL